MSYQSNSSQESSRVLIASMREVATLVAYCNLYEFEDVISNLVEADVIKFSRHGEFDSYRRIYKALNKTIASESTARKITNWARKKKDLQSVEREYHLFLVSFNSPYDLFMLFSLKDWRKRCRKAVCYIDEFWKNDIPKSQYLLNLLKDFDHIFLGTQQCVEMLGEITGRPCTYLPPSVDTLKFCPAPLKPQRSIDVCNLGRRSPIIHQSLIEIAEKGQLFYYYDTITAPKVTNSSKQITFNVNNHREHRLLLANLLKRSRYFFANRARVNEPDITQSTDEISCRFFEGAAAGTIMLGEPPRNEEFKKYFDWPDAVIQVPFNSQEIVSIITELETQPQRLERIEKNNIINSLLRHDSVYRLEEIFGKVGLELTAGMLSRKYKLKSLANSLQKAG